ncbi:PREDICTED: cuticle protein 16.8-like [Rhagoletis zephyria]|uniref:cuticle protein 16.8-like n=1 Tax=Rhagoletis zephyria TaxID=28612 RepID=UPI0008113B24|nr:PREDICTED: cuticle protein 16.8-like [Rhagoletis zephyria]
MFKANIILAAICVFATTSVNAGLIETHHVVHEPVLAKVGSVVHSAPSAVSHQSITQVHGKSVVEPVLAHAVKTTIHSAPVVHSVHSAPVLHSVHSAPVLHSVHSAPLVHSVHSAPVVHSVHSAPLVHSVHAAPVLHAAPLAYTLHHH